MTMQLCGASSIAELDRGLLRRRTRSLAVLAAPPVANNEPDANDDAAEEEKNSTDRPKDHPGCQWRHQGTQLPPGSRSGHLTPRSEFAPHAANRGSHLSVSPQQSGRQSGCSSLVMSRGLPDRR